MAVIGSVYVTMGMLREAQPLLEESLRIREQWCGPDTLETAESLHDLATLRFANFDFSSTSDLLERALAIRLRYLGPQDPETIRTKFNLAWLAVTNGHSTKAEKQAAVPLMEEVLDFHRRENTSPNRYGFALIGLAMLRYDVESKPMHAAALVAEANRVLTENGDSDIGAGLLLMMRSYVQNRVGRGSVAISTIEAGIQRIRKAAGDRHPVLIWPHFMWAEALLSTGRNQEALAVYRETVDLCRSIYGDRHRSVGLTKLRMADSLVLTDEVAEAEAVLRPGARHFSLRREEPHEPCQLPGPAYEAAASGSSIRGYSKAVPGRIGGARAIKENKESAAYLIGVLRKTALAEEMVGNWDAAYLAQQEAIDRNMRIEGRRRSDDRRNAARSGARGVGSRLARLVSGHLPAADRYLRAERSAGAVARHRLDKRRRPRYRRRSRAVSSAGAVRLGRQQQEDRFPTRAGRGFVRRWPLSASLATVRRAARHARLDGALRRLRVGGDCSRPLGRRTGSRAMVATGRVRGSARAGRNAFRLACHAARLAGTQFASHRSQRAARTNRHDTIASHPKGATGQSAHKHGPWATLKPTAISRRRRGAGGMPDEHSLFEASTRHSDDTIWVVDVAGHILFSNREMPALVVNDPAKATLLALLPEACHAPARKRLRSGCELRQKDQFELRWLDGTIRSTRVVPLAGQATATCLVIASEITCLRRAEASLRKSEHRFRQLAENVREVFWLMDSNDRRVLYVTNAYQRVWGRSTKELYDGAIGWFDCIHAEDRARVERAFTAGLQAGAYQAEYRILRPDGSLRLDSRTRFRKSRCRGPGVAHGRRRRGHHRAAQRRGQPATRAQNC